MLFGSALGSALEPLPSVRHYAEEGGGKRREVDICVYRCVSARGGQNEKDSYYILCSRHRQSAVFLYTISLSA